MRHLSEELALINDFKRRIPVDVDLLARSLNLRVRYANLSDETSGMIEADQDGRYTITVNENHPKTRQRFTIAHELGHYIYHRHLIGDGIEDDRAYRSSNSGVYRNRKIGRRQETQANQFAATILMPLDPINQMLSETGINDPAEAARIVQVSEQSYRIRMGLPPNEKQHAFAL